MAERLGGGLQIPLRLVRLQSVSLMTTLNKLLAQLEELNNEPEFDDYGRLRPTPTVYAESKRILCEADAVAPLHECGHVATDDNGSVRVEWLRRDCSMTVTLVVRDAPQFSYVYRHFGDYYDAKAFDFTDFTQCLQKLNGERCE